MWHWFLFFLPVAFAGNSPIQYGKVVSLMNVVNDTGFYCASEGDCGAAHFDMVVNCDRSHVHTWEMYCFIAVEDETEKWHSSNFVANGSLVGIRSYNWNRYCASEEKTDHVIHCTREDLREWEIYVIITEAGEELRDGDRVYIFSNQWGTYCVPRAGAVFLQELYCDVKERPETPNFIVQKVSPSYKCSMEDTEPRMLSDEYYGEIAEEEKQSQSPTSSATKAKSFLW